MRNFLIYFAAILAGGFARAWAGWPGWCLLGIGIVIGAETMCGGDTRAKEGQHDGEGPQTK